MAICVCDYIYVLSERRRRLLKGTGRIEMTETMAVAFTMTGQMTAEEGCGWRGCIGKEEAGTNQIKREIREAWVSKNWPIQEVPVKGDC